MKVRILWQSLGRKKHESKAKVYNESEESKEVWKVNEESETKKSY